jgi:hypothetical protein
MVAERIERKQPMAHTILIAVALASMMSGQSGTASQAPAAAPESAVATGSKHASETVRTSDADEKITCRNERKVGSNMITRVCKTAGQRRADAQKARDAMQSGRGINRDIGN